MLRRAEQTSNTSVQGIRSPGGAEEPPVGTGEVLKEGERVALLGYGYGVSIALDAAEREGFRTRMFGGADMARLPLYDPRATSRTADEEAFVDAVRQASAVIIASPGYHGSISGVVKNALDLLEETAKDARPYLADMPVGLIATAYGWQATGSTIAALRSIVHALRGWPTPFAAAINTQVTKFDDEGGANDPAVVEQLGLIGRQVARFAPLAAA